jgi:RimJ/RimL family protein N-acetyltransferase
MSAIDHAALSAGPYLLQPPAESEAEQALALLLDPDVAQWNPAPTVTTLDAARDWCRRGRDWSLGNHATWSVLNADGRLLANVSLWRIDQQDQRTGSIGYRTAPWARNRGVASHAVAAVTTFAFDTLKLDRIELHHAVVNVGSCRVAQKCGYAQEGVLRQSYRDVHGRRWDEHLHARLAID